jgi:hypothetical protein
VRPLVKQVPAMEVEAYLIHTDFVFQELNKCIVLPQVLVDVLGCLQTQNQLQPVVVTPVFLIELQTPHHF